MGVKNFERLTDYLKTDNLLRIHHRFESYQKNGYQQGIRCMLVAVCIEPVSCKSNIEMCHSPYVCCFWALWFLHTKKGNKISSLHTSSIFHYFRLFVFNCRSNHSGNNGSSGSLPSSGIGGNGVSSLNSDETNNSEYLNNNNNSADNSAGAEICDVPYEVANQKRHVSSLMVNVRRWPTGQIASYSL